MTMRPVDVYTNLKNHDYDIGNYPMREPEAVVCLDAISKQLPNKPDIVTEPDGTKTPICHKCFTIVVKKYCPNYCPECGQAIRWKDEK